MSWVTIIWSMTASACVTLAAIHLVVWCQRRTAWANLLFSLASGTVAVYTVLELGLMRAETPAQFATTLRWIHVPVWVFTLSFVGFVRLHLRAGRVWLAWTVCALRTLALLLNFLVGQNLNYLEVTRLGHVPFLGESVSVAEGVSNPWMLFGQLSLVVLLFFTAEAALTVWRRGDRRQALATGGSVVIFSLAAIAEAVLVFWQIVDWPLSASFFFLGIVVAMGYELSLETLQAARLSDELRESEERFRSVANTAPVLIWMSGTDKLCTFFNQGWLDFTGRALEQELGDGWVQGVHPEDASGCLKQYVEAFDARRPFALDYRLRRHDGEYRWITDHGVPRYDPAGTFLGYIGSCVDLTERRLADEKFRLAVEASPNGIVLVNDQGRVLLVNAETERLFGYTREELSGQSIEMLVPERFRGAHPGHRAGFFAAPQARAMGAGRELFARRKDGTEFPVEIGLRPIRSAEGMLVLTAIVDITARKQAEAETLRQRTEVAHFGRVAVMGELASSLAHELNQPLGAILRNAEAAELFLQDPAPDLEEVRAILADIRADDHRAGTVIDQMRAFLKRREFQGSRLDLNVLLTEVAALVRPDAQTRQVTLVFEPASALPPVMGDRVQLQQVLLNLLLNAMDAMLDCAPAARRVVVQAQALDGEVEVAVRDAGHGIQVESLNRIFEPFFTTKPHGLGIGLAISRTITMAHGGRILAENNPEGGATFRVRLPAVAEGLGGKE